MSLSTRRWLASAAFAAVIVTGWSPRPQAQAGLVASVPWRCLAAPATGRSARVVDPACGAYSPQSPAIHLALRTASRAAPIAVPAAPTAFTAIRSGNDVVFTWNAQATGDSSTTYVLEVGSAPGLSDIGTVDTRSAARTATITRVPMGKYFARARTRTVAGTSGASNEAIVAAGFGPADCDTKPLYPVAVRASVSGTTISLTWQVQSGGCPATSFVIEAGSTYGLADVAALSSDSAATSYEWTNAPGGSYVVAVRGVNAGGVGPGSDAVRVTVGGVTPPPSCAGVPGSPSGLTANVIGSTVLLGWAAASGSPASYVLEAGSASGQSDLFVSDTGGPATAMAITAAPGTYFLRLRARSSCGTSAPSNEIIVAVGQNPSPPGNPSMPLVRPTDLVYQGSFHLPLPDFGVATFAYGGTALAFNPARDSLFLVGHDSYQQIAEISTPAVDTQSSPTAALLQPLTDVTEGRLALLNPGDSNAKKIGGILPYAGRLYISAYSYYDGAATQVLSHFVSGSDLAVSGDIQGPYQVGSLKAGYVSGYMGLIPSAWQAALGGPALTGQCCIAIVGRTSYGPALFSMDPFDVGRKNPVPGTPLVYYPPNHPLGQWDGTNPYFNGSTEVRGVVFPEGTASVLLFGRHGIGTFCYGAGTPNQALAGRPVPNEPGVIYCFDPEDGSKGTHGYPYQYYVWAYNAADLAAARDGRLQPWDVKPYAVWPLTDLPKNGWSIHVNGAAYDPQTGRIFLSQAFVDGAKPLIHVFTVRVP